MPKSPKQKEKLLRILEILERETDENHSISTQQLIEALAKYDIEAERKSIYDDILVLQNMGYDIHQSKGHNGGYSLLARRFDRSEILPLVDAVSCSRFITEKKSRNLIAKLEGFLSHYEAGALNRDVFVTNRVKTDNESIYYVVDAVSSGICEKKKISFLYCEWNRKKELVPRHDGKRYVVSPLSLAWDDEKYYLIAYDGEYDQIRHYRVDKMKNVEILEEGLDQTDKIKKFDAVTHENMTFGMYGGEPESVTIEFPEELCGVMIDRFGKEPSILPAKEGRVSIRVKVNVSNQFFGWIAGLGAKARITAPEKTVAAYRQFLQDNLNNY